jgi:hypothetical protein
MIEILEYLGEFKTKIEITQDTYSLPLNRFDTCTKQEPRNLIVSLRLIKYAYTGNNRLAPVIQ